MHQDNAWGQWKITTTKRILKQDSEITKKWKNNLDVNHQKYTGQLQISGIRTQKKILYYATLK
jgi:hypothetical protein